MLFHISITAILQKKTFYVLTRLGATLVARSISSVIPLDDRLPFRTLRRRQLKKALASSLTIAEDEDFASFWPILEENLHERYGVSPVHSLEEITRLHSNFPRQISLFRVCDGAETLGGCIVYETDEVAHVQYIAASPRGKKCGALDLLFHQLIYDRYAQSRHPYRDHGKPPTRPSKTSAPTSATFRLRNSNKNDAAMTSSARAAAAVGGIMQALSLHRL